MKKTLIAIVLVICILFTGCTFMSNAPGSEESVSCGDINTNIPNAKYFDIFEWPTFGASTRIPVANWSDRGLILASSENTFWVEVGYATQENYDEYVEACQEAGYTQEYYNIPGSLYYGENDDGHFVQTTYNETDHYVAIQTGNVSAGWDKWWE